jgi:hydroquinone glucosyltransferase
VGDDGGDGSTVQGSEERDPCILWLNKQGTNSVLYISFGSYATLSARQLLDMALGLEASGASFLWMVRRPDAGEISAALGTPVSAMEYLPPGFEERVKGRGMCYSGWAPQMRILKHPAVGGFLSHCGWNSALETVSAGVPVLAWPMNAEQHLIRRSLSNHGFLKRSL